MNIIHLGVAFKVKDGVSYYEYNNEFYAIGKNPKFCFSARSLTNLEEKVERAFKFSDDQKIIETK